MNERPTMPGIEQNLPVLHVVLCTYNRAQLLQSALEAIANQSAPDDGRWAVLVVNNNCTDNTIQVVESFYGRVPSLEVVEEHRQGLTEARQRGFWATNAPWVAFVDDDCCIESEWVDCALRFIERRPEAAGFNGHNILALGSEQPKPWVSPGMFASGNPSGVGEQVIHSLHGAGMVLRRSAVEQSGWLDDPMAADRRGKSLVSGGDNELAIRTRAAGGNLWHVPSCRLHHEVDAERLTFAYLARLNYRLAEAYPLLHSMTYGGSRWFARFGLAVVGQFVRALGLKKDPLLAPDAGVRGRVLSICRAVGYSVGVAKLALAPSETRHKIIGLATARRVEAKS